MNRLRKVIIVVAVGLSASAAGATPPSLRLYVGFVTKLQCEGRLLVSAVGNESLVQLEALPRELGCGAILKPTGRATGRTNLLLETSTGTLDLEIEIIEGIPTRQERVVRLSANRQAGGER
jgi:hypothetical protein